LQRRCGTGKTNYYLLARTSSYRLGTCWYDNIFDVLSYFLCASAVQVSKSFNVRQEWWKTFNYRRSQSEQV